MKKVLFLFFLIFFLSLLVNPSAFIEAREPRLEAEYPDIPGAQAPTMEGGIPSYVRYIFNFAIWISGFIALGVLVYGGVKYLTSTGSPEKVKDAKDQIMAALLGLIILFGSYLILVRINPQLVVFQIEAPPVLPTLQPGVLLCKEEVDEVYVFDNLRESATGKSIEQQTVIREQLEQILASVQEKCWRVPASGNIIEEFNDIRNPIVYIISTDAVIYGAIFYKESKFGGDADIMYSLGQRIISFDGIKIRPSSVRIFTLGEPRSEAAVTLYEKIDFNREDPEKYKDKTYPVNWLQEDYGPDDFLNKPGDGDFKKYKCEEIGEDCPSSIGSLKVEGILIVIFFKEESVCAGGKGWTGETIIDVQISTRSNLYKDPMGRWCVETKLINEYWPCAACMTILSGGVL